MKQELPEIHFDGEKIDSIFGGKRHIFEVDGHEAWIVEPPEAAPGRPWLAVPEWPDHAPERNGVNALVSHGYYMVTVRLYGYYANPEAVRVMRHFYELLQGLGFARRGAFIGMSLGGLYSFRYAATYPESVACIYADAPVCDLAFHLHSVVRSSVAIAPAYGLEKDEELEGYPLSPVNNYLPMVRNQIPILLLLGLNDESVEVTSNGQKLARLYREAGGEIKVVERAYWGHHPHGLDNPLQIVNFVLFHTLNRE